MTTKTVDVLVVGAGTAGLNAALQIARTGRQVAVLERRPEGHGGASWCNGVLARQYVRAGLEPPVAPEARCQPGPAVLVSPSGRHRVHLDDNAVIEADMRELTDRLRKDAASAGVELWWDVEELTVDQPATRARQVVATVGGRSIRFRADLLVDASGRKGVIRRAVPELARWCPEPQPDELCSAAQLVLEIDDRAGAEAFLEAESVAPGVGVTALGVAGGYSLLAIRVEPDLSEVSILTGTIPSLSGTNGHELVNVARAVHPWIGKPIFGGGGLIPLRRTYDRFTAPGVALVGDAAGQVMAGHGSGIGLGLIAGKVLAEAVDRADDPGAEATLWQYQSTYLREVGPLVGAYDAFRRMSVALGTEGVEELFRLGLMRASLSHAALDQRIADPGPAEVAEMGAILVRHPKLMRAMIPTLTQMGLAGAIYGRYPRTPDPAAFRRWQRLRSVLPAQDS